MCPGGIQFVVQNQNANNSYDSKDDDCFKQLNAILTKCWNGGPSPLYGGEEEVARWRFLYDLNFVILTEEGHYERKLADRTLQYPPRELCLRRCKNKNIDSVLFYFNRSDAS